MGMHRWLLGPLICLILATTSARPPECEEPPSWSINGQQPLAENKGKASLLEALLKHFRSYGMEDLEFIIVNSKLSHSQDKFEELQKRVSFDVYQETDEDEVWSVMEGGKDDMFIYDRCGRLTYYVPFPLSILNESPLVSNAILATYFRSPCGNNCDQNRTLENDDVVTYTDLDYESSNSTEQDNSTFTETEQPMYNNETTNEMQFSNQMFYVTAPENNETNVLNFNNTQNFTDYDYPTHDNTLQMNETNTRDVDQAKSFFSSIYELFFNGRSSGDRVADSMHSNKTFNGSTFEDSNHHKMAHDDTDSEIANSHMHHMNHGHHMHRHEEETYGKQKSNRCLEADYEVCKNWSKKRLLHAQKCCSETHSDPESQRSCHNFGKKRCKKMQSILKCCIKTVYTESNLNATSSEEPATPTEESVATPTTQEHTTVTSREEQTVATQVKEVVCCKTVNRAKVCRVSYSGICEIDEYVDM